MDIKGWKRGMNISQTKPRIPRQHQPYRPKIPVSIPNVGDTILPPPEGLPPGFEGVDDSALYKTPTPNQRVYYGAENGGLPTSPFGKDGALGGYKHSTAYKWLGAHIPLPGFGSILPHLYVPMVAHLFFRSILIVSIAVLIYAVLETGWLVFIKWSKWRAPWPKSHPSQKASDTKEARSIAVRDTSGIETYEWGPMHQKDGETGGYWVDYETAFVTTALWNPIIGLIGMFIDWYMVQAIQLPPFDTHLCSEPCLDGLLVAEFIIFFLISVKLGKNTAWLWTAIGVPIFILGVMAPVNRGYTHGFNTFSPYLYWLILNVWVTLWFLRDPFGIGRIIAKYKYRHFVWKQQQQYLRTHQSLIGFQPQPLNTPFYPNPLDSRMGQSVVNPEDPRKNGYFWWSIDGTYFWNAFFSMTLMVLGVSIYRVVAIST